MSSMNSSHVPRTNEAGHGTKLYLTKQPVNLKSHSNKRGAFVSSCVDIANTLETRLRSEIIKREEKRTLEVWYFLKIVMSSTFDNNA